MKKIEYDRVLAWLRRQKVDEQDDEKSAEPPEDKGFSMPAATAPNVAWAHKGKLRLKDGEIERKPSQRKVSQT